MAEDPYRGDLEAALQRAAELEQEVERLRRELEAATAARGRARDTAADTRTDEDNALRIANADLRHENDRLRQRLESAAHPPLRHVQPVFGGGLWILSLMGLLLVLLAALVVTCAQK